ncbi:O-antigen ligase family protein [Clostridium polynesiense]|uniref:O-antigen ligase family protein n=1 Tax=Clostridium polynesiense TaxID=1325933 RepID=UPI000590E81B|nr:O-antigen ligase family protein [Clostridium polynesiense]
MIYSIEKKINNLFGAILILSSATGWYTLDYFGMNKFWLVFILLSAIFSFLVLKHQYVSTSKKGDYPSQGALTASKTSPFDILKNIFFDYKFIFFLLAYLLWITLTYFVNYTGLSTILYVGKMWFLVLIYIVLLSSYLYRCDDKEGFLTTVASYIFVLGSIHSFIAFYQFIFLRNDIAGIVLTEWPSYNPASLYGNVNGLGSYLFISIISGVYLFFKQNPRRNRYIFFITMQIYALYLTVARTSIVSLIVFMALSFVFLLLIQPKALKKKLILNNVILILICNAMFISIIFSDEIKSTFAHNLTSSSSSGKPSEKRETSDMFKEKSDKGVNNRQFIWKQVINDSKDYMLFGDGLKYNIVNRINVGEVISQKSIGVDRISYHNTLFRYFASNGIIGLMVFMCLIAYVPLSFIIIMIKNKKLNLSYLVLFSLMLALFAYMQMEEIYIGEIGFMQLTTLAVISFGLSELPYKSNK